MPLLPQPDTVSPGALQLLYRVGAIDHVTSANFLADVDVSDVGTIRSTAQTFADEVQDLLTNVSQINAWRIVDPSGVSLYEEDFDTPYVGSLVPVADTFNSQSASGSLTGKGTPAVGLAQGQTRTTVFLGIFQPVAWPDARATLTAGDTDWTDLRTFLSDSDVVGADHYGSKATYRNYWCPQINSHYQKAFGL